MLPPPPPLSSGAAGAERSGAGRASPAPAARCPPAHHHTPPSFSLPPPPSRHHAGAHRQRGPHQVRPGAGRGAAAGGAAAALPRHGQCVAGHWALRGSLLRLPGVLGAGARSLSPEPSAGLGPPQGARLGGVRVWLRRPGGREGGFRGSERFAELLSLDPPNFCFPCGVSVLIWMFFSPN